MAKSTTKTNVQTEQSTARKGTNMSDMDLINELGLGADAATETTEVTETASEGEAASRAPRSEIKVVNKPTVSVGMLPALQRLGGGGGKRGSKYPFEELAAPTKDEAGNITGYSFFEVRLSDVENADDKKLKGAVQAAVAAQNKAAKSAGSNVKYVSRALLGEDGEYVGTAVYRVDDTLGDDE